MSMTGEPRRQAWLLTLSLMVNMLLVGLIGGHVIAGGAEPELAQRPVPGDMRLARGIVAAAPPEDRARIRQALRTAFGQARPLHAERRAARRAVGAAVRKEPYDPEATLAAFARLRDADARLHAAIQAALVDQLGDLTPQQRRALGDALESDHHPRRPGHRRRHGATHQDRQP